MWYNARRSMSASSIRPSVTRGPGPRLSHIAVASLASRLAAGEEVTVDAAAKLLADLGLATLSASDVLARARAIAERDWRELSGLSETERVGYLVRAVSAGGEAKPRAVVREGWWRRNLRDLGEKLLLLVACSIPFAGICLVAWASEKQGFLAVLLELVIGAAVIAALVAIFRYHVLSRGFVWLVRRLRLSWRRLEEVTRP